MIYLDLPEVKMMKMAVRFFITFSSYKQNIKEQNISI